ncbi:MAG: hypothetical protein ACFBWO_13200 [Paracoccaceae bacterium]
MSGAPEIEVMGDDGSGFVGYVWANEHRDAGVLVFHAATLAEARAKADMARIAYGAGAVFMPPASLSAIEGGKA